MTEEAIVAQGAPEAKAQFLAQILREGELYAGLLLGKNGAPDIHLVLLPAKAEKLTWDQAKKFAADAGGELPTRREQSLLFANLKDEFEPYWHWSGEQHASYPSNAWGQYFYDGDQVYSHKSNEGRVRVVRRLIIQ
ncbi:Lcl C-terminal domain-containing protein [Rugamonas aquatica]|uniref:DUF1566 domain-containing protein n=1 Tax=Rugamonas aquatica TaxID=2743357 RepID=A0A6A7N1W9_9BURK|nr:DUF1566 domain-containing protein [Rugamonas aquatica]MQA39002.1 DUF1566 domain-containing protein [Rugamonas aquatica]